MKFRTKYGEKLPCEAEPWSPGDPALSARLGVEEITLDDGTVLGKARDDEAGRPSDGRICFEPGYWVVVHAEPDLRFVFSPAQISVLLELVTT
jgi:hypothetical protein